MELFYEDLGRVLKEVESNKVLMIMGDMNAKVGKGRYLDTVGNWGLGSKNERRNRLVEFCEENDLMVVNTFCKHHPRRLYTWKSPGVLQKTKSTTC